MGNKKQKQVAVLKHFETLSQQNNIFIQNEIQSINNLCQTSPELASRLVTILEEGQKINKDNNNRIIALEENEQEMRKDAMRFQHRFMMFGAFTFLALFLIPFILGIWLIFEGKAKEGSYCLAISMAIVSPRIYKEFKTPKT